MAIPRAEIQTLNPGSLWVGYVLDCSPLGGDVYYLHAGLNALGDPVTWQGQAYTPMPIYGSGFEASTNGALPHPQIQVSNLDGLVAALAASLDDLTGAIVTRKQVLTKYLDAVNFAAGNATADPTAGYEDDVWVVEQKTAETQEGMTFELVAFCDAQGLSIPGRMIQAATCPWSYKNADGSGLCPYIGPLPTCDRHLNSPNGCVAHFHVTAGDKATVEPFSCSGSIITGLESDFIANGFLPGQEIRLAGFLTDNRRTFPLVNVSEHTLEVSGSLTTEWVGLITESISCSGSSFLGNLNDFVSSGIAPGQTIVTSGFGEGGNNGDFLVVEVTPGAITVGPRANARSVTGVFSCSGSTITGNDVDFLDDYSFTAGQNIVTSGFVNPGNNGTFTIQSLTTHELRVNGSLTSESAGDGKKITFGPLTNEASGPGRTIQVRKMILVRPPLSFGGFPGALQVSR